MEPLTRRQREILEYIKSFLRTHGYAPSLEEIARRFGLASVATVHKHLTELERRGAVRRLKGRRRHLEVVPESPAGEGAVELPLLGNIAAGEPIEAVTVEEPIGVPADMIRRRQGDEVGDGVNVGGGVGEDYVEVRFPYTPSPDYQPPWNVVCKSAWAEEFYLMTVIPILYIPPDYAPNSGYGTFNESNEYVTVINDPGGETAKAVDIVEVEMKIASGSGEYLYVKIIDAGPIDPSNPPSPPVGGIVCPPSTTAILKEKCSQNVFPFPRVGGPSGI